MRVRENENRAAALTLVDLQNGDVFVLANSFAPALMVRVAKINGEVPDALMLESGVPVYFHPDTRVHRITGEFVEDGA